METGFRIRSCADKKAVSVYYGGPSGSKAMNVKPNTQNANAVEDFPVDDLRAPSAPAGHALAEAALSRLRDEDAAVRSQERARHHADENGAGRGAAGPRARADRADLRAGRLAGGQG